MTIRVDGESAAGSSNQPPVLAERRDVVWRAAAIVKHRINVSRRALHSGHFGSRRPRL